MNSDDEQQHGRVGASSAMDNDELSLPKATINKIISGQLRTDTYDVLDKGAAP